MLLTFKRCLSAFLCAVLTVSLVPAAAAEETVETVFSVPPTVFHTEINPLYEDVYPFTESTENFEEMNLLYSDSTAEHDPSEYFTAEEDALEAIRAGFLSRTAEIYVKYRIPHGDDVSTAALDLWHASLEHTGDPGEGDTMRWQFGKVSYGSLGGFSDGTYDYLTFAYIPAYYTTAEQEAEVDTAVEDLLSELDLDGKSDFEIVQSVYDWICENVRYDYDNLPDDSYVLKHTAYAALIDKTAVCQGYALLMYRLLLENGIDCRLIPGDGGGPHAWNIVELNNFYYNADSTWDEGKTPDEYQWFLLNEENFTDHIRYNNSSYGYYDTEEFHAAYPMAAENYITHEPDEIHAEGTLDEENGITWSLTYDGTLTISGEGAMPDFTQKTDDGYPKISTEFLPWNSLRSKIVKIVVEPGITSIGNGAFYECTDAVSAEIADTVTKIGMWAFTDCSSLEEIYIPKNVTSIDYAAFENCTSLEAILFSKTVPTIDSSAFTGVTATAYYPAGYNTWTSTVSQTYGGEITWKELELFEISDVDDLYRFAELVNSGHVYLDAELLNDITVNEDVLGEDGFPDVENREFRVWTPIGNSTYRYLGNFDGGSHTVSGLFFYDSSVSDVGFFGYMGQNAANGYIGCIENLTVADSYFNGRGAGGIAGSNGGGTIQNCINHSTIISSDSAGGITGYSDGPLLDCVNTGIVRGNSAVGGIAGQIVDSDISRCKNSGEVTSFGGSVGSGISVGGIVGLKAQSGTISYCTNLGDITGVTEVGGIAGTHERDRVINCLNSGSVTGNSSVGGISGYLKSGSVQNCFDHGTGSIFGSCPSGTVSSCYYLADSETDSQSGTTAVNLKRCRSGEVAFLLGSAWGQNIGREDFPVLNGMKVYKTTEDSPCTGYTNNADGIKEHEYEDGLCKWCGAEEFHEPNYDVNGNGSAASDDALYLLRYTILPDRYPLAVDDADFDGDGYVTAKDAVFLLNALGSTVIP